MGLSGSFHILLWAGSDHISLNCAQGSGTFIGIFQFYIEKSSYICQQRTPISPGIYSFVCWPVVESCAYWPLAELSLKKVRLCHGVNQLKNKQVDAIFYSFTCKDRHGKMSINTELTPHTRRQQWANWYIFFCREWIKTITVQLASELFWLQFSSTANIGREFVPMNKQGTKLSH